MDPENGYIPAMDDFVMRTVYLPIKLEAELRQLSREMDCTFSELVRAAIASKLIEWQDSKILEKDLIDSAGPALGSDKKIRIAMAIEGPVSSQVGKEHLDQLRQIRWDMLSSLEKRQRLAQAQSVMNEIEI